MLKITKAILTKWFHKNSKLRRKHKQKMFLKYYSKDFLCTECEEWRNRYHDEYPCFGEEPGSNLCIYCFHNKRGDSRKRDYHQMVHYKYSIVGMTVEQAQVAANRAFELHEWYGREIFGRKYIPRHITHRY